MPNAEEISGDCMPGTPGDANSPQPLSLASIMRAVLDPTWNENWPLELTWLSFVLLPPQIRSMTTLIGTGVPSSMTTTPLMNGIGCRSCRAEEEPASGCV